MEVSLPDLRRLLPALLPTLGSAAIIVLWVGIRGTPPAPWQLSLFAAWFALLAWISAYRRYRFFADTPQCSAVRSAPQGYVSLQGIGRALPGDPLRSPLNYLPCLWYRIRIEERDSRDKWRVVTDESSDDSFVLEDASGARCTVDPVGARLEVHQRDHVREHDRRTTQWLLVPGTKIHVLGDFRSLRAIEQRASASAETRDLLAEWKRSGHALSKFDADGNGELDMEEWQAARDAAKQEIRRERLAATDFPPQHQITAPQDNRPFVISDHPADQVRQRYQRQAWGCLAGFFFFLILAGWLAGQA